MGSASLWKLMGVSVFFACVCIAAEPPNKGAKSTAAAKAELAAQRNKLRLKILPDLRLTPSPPIEEKRLQSVLAQIKDSEYLAKLARYYGLSRQQADESVMAFRTWTESRNAGEKNEDGAGLERHQQALLARQHEIETLVDSIPDDGAPSVLCNVIAGTVPGYCVRRWGGIPQLYANRTAANTYYITRYEKSPADKFLSLLGAWALMGGANTTQQVTINNYGDNPGNNRPDARQQNRQPQRQKLGSMLRQAGQSRPIGQSNAPRTQPPQQKTPQQQQQQDQKDKYQKNQQGQQPRRK